MVENARRRWPAVRLLVRHALVQGPQAAEQVIAALRRLDGQPEVDVIVIARGGGSLEDLLPFSDEGLIRAVSACRTPVVSAIGHESDNPILDLVADYRASTPTDAAKRVVPDAADELARIRQVRQRMRQCVATLVARQQEALTALRSRPVLADPTASFGLRRDEVERLRRPGPASRSPPGWTRRERPSVIPWNASGPSPRRPRSSAGTRSWSGRPANRSVR